MPDTVRASSGPANVVVVLVDDGYASVALAAADIFGSAGSLWDVCLRQEPVQRFNVVTASADGKPVTTFGGVELTPMASIDDVATPDLVFVPDAGLDVDVILSKNAKLLPWLAACHAGGARVAGVCTGAAILAGAGLLEGRRATTHWAMIDTLRGRWPGVDWRGDMIVTEQDNVYCGSGVYAAMDLSLYLVEKLCDHATAVQTARSLLLEMPRTQHAGFGVLPLATPHQDETVRKAEEVFQKSFRDEVRVDGVAMDLGMSPRNSERRFRAATGLLPRAYLQKLRVLEAQRLLEDGSRSIQEVASAAGYEDLQFFRAIFKRHAGMSPTDYRKRFGAPPAGVLVGR